MSGEFYTPQEVAELLKISKTTVLSNIHSGRWDCLKISARTYRFSHEQFEQIVSNPAVDRRVRRSRERDSELRRALRQIS